MLKTHAHTFRSRGRLAVGLSWLAGYTNAIMLIAAGQTISHQTGNTTHLGEQAGQALLGQRDALVEAVYFAGLVACFLAGAFASGVVTELARRTGRRSRFVLPMTIEGLLLSVVLLLMLRYPHPQHGGPLVAVTFVAAMAMGLQNATITRISGAVVRTTHLTGVVTDLGLELALMVTGRRRRRWSWRHFRRQSSAQRALLLSAIFATFLAGAALGTVAYEVPHVGAAALLLPILFLVALVLHEHLAEVAEVQAVDVPAEWAEVIPPGVGLFRLRHRSGRVDHPPDFTGWAERLPASWRVVVLSIDPLTRFHADAAVDLLAAAGVLRAGGRTLLVVGMRRSQLQLLRHHDPHHRLKWEDFPPDLEFAVARAINLAAADATGRAGGVVQEV